ncbi:hypothetical protein [Pseudomonas sp. PSB11]|uniref:hypothetical protein n=1 Tax=Pseudomonas sp. PSB11 TaxID=2021969 RepID=UPI0016606266|nr:hypothetical protein [Pseudomonas sp. PSB11]MBD0679933.1 hypothetical protein [Pseudomonas sp. PSB11]
MSIRRYNKDHQWEFKNNHAETPELVTPPPPLDALQFWTQHPTQNHLVDLKIFADGQDKSLGTSKWNGPFTGRPKLIRQLKPAIQAIFTGLSPATVRNYTKALRAWWRLMDSVESSAKEVDHSVMRVEDVSQLTWIHREHAYKAGIHGDMFTYFLRIANITLKARGGAELHWQTPAGNKPERHLPPEDQIAALRMGLKQSWEAVRRRWALIDRVQSDCFVPQTAEEADLLKQWLYFSEKQRTCGLAVPNSDQLRGGLLSQSFTGSTRLSLIKLRETVFPNVWDVDTAFHMCLANTGLNPAVLFALDARFEGLFLRDHPQDKSRYILVGPKTRAGGTEQVVTGLWKTPWGPGPIIRNWLERVDPLRKQLQSRLAVERDLYDQMCKDGDFHDELVEQLHLVQNLEQGSRSIWLYIGKHGNIDWLNENRSNRHSLDHKQTTYLKVLTSQINGKRIEQGCPPIGHITTSDFRDIFALYVWRQSGGNVLAVMRLLSHSRLRSTQCYVDNNILNAERNLQARIFLDRLFVELGQGRLDVTILAYLQQSGAMSPEVEKCLHDFRAMERSRLGIACQDPLHPPPNIQPDADGSLRCGIQRCLLCKQGLILPESFDGIAMRVEELEVIQRHVSVEAWLTSDLPQELSNGLDALKLFPTDDVQKAREHWAQAIACGAHRVPGVHLATNKLEVVWI